jgi:CRISPR-associated protein Csb1
MDRVLFALALFKVQKFLATGLRLRTACDLAVTTLVVKAPLDFQVPPFDGIVAALPGLIQEAHELFASPAVTTTIFTGGEKKAKEGKTKAKEAKAS